jgi:hypothetical protein
MIGVVAILGAVLALAVILRVGTAALMVSGLSREVARFQVRSAFFGVGFTTNEAETITNHPFRRRLVQFLMLLGSIGITGVIGSAAVTLAREDENIWLVLLVLGAGLLALYGLASWKWLDRQIIRFFEALLRRFTDLEAHDYQAMLRLSKNYAVRQFTVHPGAAVEGRAIGGLRHVEGLVLLGIEREGEYLGVPDPETVLLAGDLVTLYGHNDALERVAAAGPPPR